MSRGPDPHDVQRDRLALPAGRTPPVPDALVVRLPPLAAYLEACFPDLGRLDLVLERRGAGLRLRARFSFADDPLLVRLAWFDIAEPGERRDLLTACSALQDHLHCVVPGRMLRTRRL